MTEIVSKLDSRERSLNQEFHILIALVCESINLFKLYEFLENLTGRKVEVLTRAGLSKYIGPHILKDLEDVAL